MSLLSTNSVTEQVAAHLREGIQTGRWTGLMPGRNRLAKELGVSPTTITRALNLLEKKGLIVAQGAGQRRRITARKKRRRARATKVLIFLYEPEEDDLNHYVVALRQQLHAAGHTTVYASKTLKEMKHDPKQVLAMMKAEPADAYIVIAGGRFLLEELSKAPFPVFAFFGAARELPIAGAAVTKATAVRECIQRLLDTGRQRIVMLLRDESPQSESILADELKKRGLPHGRYNVPKWENSPEGLRQCLSELFKVTPPEAILVDDWILSFAIEKFLARSQGPAYRRAVCISMDYHPSFKWCQPGLPYFYWDPNSVTRLATKWVNNIAKGKEDQSQKLVEAKFIDGGALTSTPSNPAEE